MKALHKLPYPPNEIDQQTIIARVLGSPQRLFIAFEFLLWRQKARSSFKFLWFEATALQLLGNGESAPNLGALPSPTDARLWVLRELKEINTVAEWKKYVASGRHLWLLFAIIPCTSNALALVEAVRALAECLEHLQPSAANANPKKTQMSAADPQWITRLIKSRIPPKPELGRVFAETIFSLNAIAELSNSLREEANSLRSQLQSTQGRLKSETEARTNVESREQQLNLDLANTKDELAETKRALEEEKKHNIRSGGFASVTKREIINQVMAMVRQGISHRLESIRHYADRETPNRGEIIELVNEAEKQLAGVEERLIQ